MALYEESVEIINEALAYTEQMEESREKEYFKACCYNLRGFVIADIEGSGSRVAYADKIKAREILIDTKEEADEIIKELHKIKDTKCDISPWTLPSESSHRVTGICI